MEPFLRGRVTTTPVTTATVAFVDTFFSGFNQNSVAHFADPTPGDPVRITTPTGNFVTGPQLSPDQTKVAYIDNHNLYVVSWPNGGDETKIVDSGTHGWVDSCWWSPDSSTIIYCVNPGTSIYTVAPDGSGDTAIYTDPSARKVGGPSYNHDGSLIAFQVLKSATTFGVFVANADGTGAAQVGTDSPTQFSGVCFGQPAYSWGQVSNVVAYGGGTLAAPTMRKVSSNGAGDTLLGSASVGYGRPFSHRFTADDQHVLYHANFTQDIRQFAADGSGNSLVHAGAVPLTSDIYDVAGTIFVCQNSSPKVIASLAEDGSGYAALTSGTDTVSLS